MGGWVRPRATLEVAERRNIFSTFREVNQSHTCSFYGFSKLPFDFRKSLKILKFHSSGLVKTLCFVNKGRLFIVRETRVQYTTCEQILLFSTTSNKPFGLLLRENVNITPSLNPVFKRPTCIMSLRARTHYIFYSIVFHPVLLQMYRIRGGVLHAWYLARDEARGGGGE
jgi:hypothetical protein